MSVNLAPRLESSGAVRAMSDTELKDLNAKFLEDILHLRDRLIARGELYRLTPATKALKHLQKSRLWITQELQSRDAERRALLSAREKELKAIEKLAATQLEKQKIKHRRDQKLLEKQLQQQAAKAKLDRIKEANNQDRQDIALFKAVCRDVVGHELYAYLWEETRRRMEAA